VDPNTDQGFSAEAELQRIGDGDNLHHTGVTEALNTPTHSGLGEADVLGDRPVGATPVTLKELHNAPVDRVKRRRRRRLRCHSFGVLGPVVGSMSWHCCHLRSVG
jgi:hypothetical protein